MEYQQLGTSELKISRIGLGCMSLGEDQQANETLLHRAIELGVNFFDTADLYQKGMNEVSVGKALKPKRKELIIATKVGNQWRADGSGWDWNPTKAYIISSVEDSLKRLQTDYIDLYQLHGGTLEDPIDETISAFEQLKQQGKIRYYGISSIRPNVIREYIKRSNIVSVMMQYSLLDRRPAETCLSLLQQNNIGVLVRGAVAQGLLVNKPAKAYLNYSAEQVQQVATAIRSQTTNDRNEAQTAIRYVLQHPAVTAAIVGARTRQQLEEAIHTTDTSIITKTGMDVLEQSIPVNLYEQHR
jgi:aryl-alcohol dehydrogenase-like predicted oxidoreductase